MADDSPKKKPDDISKGASKSKPSSAAKASGRPISRQTQPKQQTSNASRKLKSNKSKSAKNRHSFVLDAKTEAVLKENHYEIKDKLGVGAFAEVSVLSRSVSLSPLTTVPDRCSRHTTLTGSRLVQSK